MSKKMDGGNNGTDPILNVNLPNDFGVDQIGRAHV